MEKKRTRRSFVQLLSDYKAALASFDAKVERQRSRLVAKIEKLEERHAVLALGMETLGDSTPEEAQAALDAQIEELRKRRKAVRRLSQIA